MNRCSRNDYFLCFRKQNLGMRDSFSSSVQRLSTRVERAWVRPVERSIDVVASSRIEHWVSFSRAEKKLGDAVLCRNDYLWGEARAMAFGHWAGFSLFRLAIFAIFVRCEIVVDTCLIAQEGR